MRITVICFTTAALYNDKKDECLLRHINSTCFADKRGKYVLDKFQKTIKFVFKVILVVFVLLLSLLLFFFLFSVFYSQ